MNFNNTELKKNITVQYSPVTKHFPIIIFTLCWMAYASAYFCRVNMSVAIPAIENSLGLSKTSLGLVGSCFFWVYALGQLINGYIGDKVSGRIFIFIGLLVSSTINILFSFTSKIVLMMILWAINGFFLSMLWGPIIRILAKWFPKEKNTQVSVGISTSMVGGYLLAWGLSGQILAKTSWQWVFRVPGILVFIYATIWFILMKNEERYQPYKSEYDNIVSGENQESLNEIQKKGEITLWQLIKKTKLWLVAITCIAQGIIKESIGLWGPTYLMETQNLDLTSTTGYILLIPIMNFGGMMLAGWLNKKLHYRHKLAIMTLFGACVVSITALFLFARFSIIIGVVLLGCCSGLMYGTNTLLLSVIPMGFADYNKSSSVAGFLDFSAYIGAGISGIMIGAISEHWGWNGIIIIWICIAMIGMISIFINSKNKAY